MRFYSFDWGKAAAFGSCSHCFHPASTDSGARTINTREIKFDASVKLYFNFQFPFRAIFQDEDGSVTGKGEGSWATAYWKHLVGPTMKECEFDEEKWPERGAVYCDNTV